MNILYLHTHDTGRYIQPYGYAVSTPNLMNLAREGTLFRQAYCAGPTCSPSRAGLLTGMSPHSCGMLGLAHRGFRLYDYHQHLARFLGDHGYETVLCGVQHEALDPDRIGYRRNITVKRRGTYTEMDEANSKAAADYLWNPHGDPFFLSMGLNHTHRKFPGIDPFINPDYVMPPFPMYDTPECREDMAAFMSSVMIADRCYGRVLEALRQSGHDKDTLVILTTDHGIAFPHMKCNLYDTGIGVSLILRYPGNPLKGKASDALISQLDLFPTICDMIHVEKPDWLQGHSMMPLFGGTKDSIRNEIFAEVTFHAAYEPMRCIRTRRYKLIRFYDECGTLPCNIDDSLSKSFLMKNGLLKHSQERGHEMLFDLYLDPVERINLAGDPQYESIHADLSTRLESWQNTTADPLLKGEVPLPDGAIVNKPSCISPQEKDYT